MHVMQINVPLDPLHRAPDELLRGWYLLEDVAGSAASAQVRVSVVQANHTAAILERRGATFHFVPPDVPGTSAIGGRAFRKLLQQLKPDVFHVHGLGFPRECAVLGALAPHVPVLLQDHANHVPRFWRRSGWRRGLVQVAGVAFCAREQAAPFVESRVLPADVRVYEYAGTSAMFVPGDQAAARTVSGLFGDPCVLWVGHLNDNKDPLTILRGLRNCITHMPDAHLWCCFGTAPLLDAVQREIAHAPLAGRVHLVGKVGHDRIESFMQAADIFVLGSHKEGSGVALIEALATGLTPVVSDIPSFRALTGRGAVGNSWRCGDPADFARALLAAASRPRAAARAEVRSYFERELSFEAGGRKLRNAYDDMLVYRGRLAPAGVPA
jgi:glycosyltransferase involved in cell wall biosynthesis